MNNKKQIFFGILFFILFILIITTEKPNSKISWFPSYAVNHKIPFGTYILYHEAKNIFNDRLIPTDKSPYILLRYSTDSTGVYIGYNLKIEFAKTNINTLLNWVDKGNKLFLFANNFNSKITDTLGFSTERFFGNNFTDSTTVFLKNQSKKFSIKNKYFIPYIISLKDSLNPNIEKLGFYDQQHKYLNFIKIKFGKGEIYVHSFPVVLTNYFILQKDNYKYDESLLDLINTSGKIYWDTHYQIGAGKQGIFRVLMEHPAFLWAYRLMFAGIIIFIIFQSKRRQKPIPVIKPITNETLSFTKTIAEMYLENKAHEEMADLQIKLFYDWLRTKTQIIVNEPADEEIMQKISQKTKTSLEDVEAVFDMIKYLRNVQIIRAKDVLKLEKLIEKIKK